jgi:hypothetical protein
MEDQFVKLKLIDLLGKANCDHKTDIRKEPDLKRAHIYCKLHQLPGQVAGPLVEGYIQCKYGMVKNDSSLCIGDLRHKETNFEIKISNGGKENNKFNYVQLRMNHTCDYLLTAYYLSPFNVENFGELFIFKLAKPDLKHLLLQYGGYAHGTKKKLGEITQSDLDNPLNDKEYAIRPKYGDGCWCDLLKFRIQESDLENEPVQSINLAASIF